MLRQFIRLPDGWLFFAGYCLIALGYVFCGLMASVVATPFLALVIAYFFIAFILTLVKVFGLRRLELTQLNFLVFEFITIAGFIIVLATCE
ncbi:hypothetical protein [Levilactobacillus acidifarinae]|uniref:Uncharacterized protein n=1 Tax=Levilactobacillus acidifarinae DSM 19394 = JCM 15949 TaxID=1423715 RepID=A0A0R1LGA9_9LACO|nr:hypothetical protein [Levilactobacillus acidifarinae]KRK94719.1 hypothetical protein FD25_GL000692 [Levilactobacillus acidifarinae DSM 19394]GEO68476.1 hypothetical protein LAC03_03860 [Levilactobacillus acidifarinae]